MPKTLPHGMIVNKATGEAAPASARVVELVLEGLEKDQAIKPLTQRLNAIKTELKTLVPPNSVVTLDELAEVPITLRQQVVIVDEARLKAALGKRFVDLVNIHVEYQPTEKLLALASDADHPLAETLRACLEVKETLSISFKPLAPAKPKRGKAA